MIQNLRIAVLLCLLFSACSHPQLTHEGDLYQWLNAPEHGFIKVVEKENLLLTAKFLPPELLAIKDIKARISPATTYDSLKAFHQKSMTFLIQIKSKRDGSENLLYDGIYEPEDYKIRVGELNYHLDEYISLKCGQNIYTPVLHSFENTYGLRASETLYLVFVPDFQDADFPEAAEMELIFNDEIFNTGKNSFIFQQEDLNTLPDIKNTLIQSL